MADLIDFRKATYAEIVAVSKNAEDIYFATDKPLIYAQGQWLGVASMTSSVNASTGAITITLNSDAGTKIAHTISGAGMTTEQKNQLATAYNFVTEITGTDSDAIINKWAEIVDFLSGIENTDTLDALLDDISTQIAANKTAIDAEVTARKGITIEAGAGLDGGGDLSANRTIAMGAPSDITDSSTSIASGTTHTHAIDKASTSKRGIVQLNDTLTSTSTEQALTANQGKVLNGQITSEAKTRAAADTALQTNIDNEATARETADNAIYAFIETLFTPEYDTTTGELLSIQANAGLWSEEYISAKGKDDSSSGLGVDLTAVWNSLRNNSDTFANYLINIAHIPVAAIGEHADFISAVEALLTASNMPTITASKISDFATQVESLISSWSAARKVKAGTGLSGGGTLDNDVTISLATVGTAGTYYKVVVDGYGRVVSGNTSLAISDVTGLSDTFTAIHTTVSNHDTRITSVENRMTTVESALQWKALTD